MKRRYEPWKGYNNIDNYEIIENKTPVIGGI